ncbi:MAG: two-component system sensor histidine kinase CreC [Betaproteobacteria bacterium]|nr:two-component system sensor histidine kinase CreC [Betaproteobacteria bacterium]
MRLSLRLLLGYFLVVGVAAWFVLNVFVNEVKPGVRQAMEDTLVDTASLLAEIARDDLLAGTLQQGRFAAEVARYRNQSLTTPLWGLLKTEPGFRIYVTDVKGIVQYDSSGADMGKDYSRWNDVYLTLRGKYGARTSTEGSEYNDWTVMHVAAPIRQGERIVGSLTVAKPNRLVQPYIERSEAKIRRAGWLLLGITLTIGLIVALGLHRNLQKLEAYAAAVSRGERADLPKLSVKELRTLGTALEAMRERLEGRQYVEQYVATLTHEMKSPLTAIQGAAELLQDPSMSVPDRNHFIGNIREQVGRLKALIERMLNLASVEHRRKLEGAEELDLRALTEEVINQFQPQITARGLQLSLPEGAAIAIHGEAFLLKQAIANLLDNAIAFSPPGGTLEFTLKADPPTLTLRDHGPGIPDYAQDQVFERFYSLPRPDGSGKSTGLGLAFVREVALLHGGTVTLANHVNGGAIAELIANR